MDVSDNVFDIDMMLENENIHNRSESWNKLHKTTKIQKLHAYAEKYGNQNNYSLKESRQLKHFLTESLEKKKLQKTKDLNYNKVKGEITEIPGLLFNRATNQFTLRVDTKRVSTLSSLTPKRFTQKNQKIEETTTET
jgi:hypothetical protein